MATAAGVTIVSTVLHGIWKDDPSEYAEIDRALQNILKDNPNFYLILRIRLNPPQWWMKAFPDDTMKLGNGKTANCASVASERYRRDAGEALRRLIRHVEKNFGDHIAGYHPAGANSSEWFYYGCQFPEFNGYDLATLTAWRKWLRNKYLSDQGLQQAWKDSKATFDTVGIPTQEERRGQKQVGLRAPENSARVLDFSTFQNDSMAEMVLGLGRIIREETGRTRLSVIFFGYVFELAPLWNGPGVSGHLSFRKILSSPDFDIITAPFSYNSGRSLNDGIPVMSAAESTMLAGKLWLNEDDTHTHLALQIGDRDCSMVKNGAENESQTLNLLRRNLAMTFACNYGIWWMDLYGNGRYNSPSLWREMEQFANRFEKKNLASPNPFTPDIALFADPGSLNSVIATGASTPTTKEAVSLIRKSLSKVGAPYGSYLLDDLVDGKTTARLNIFPAAYALGAKSRQALKKAAEKSAALWIWAPGYINLDTGKISLDSVHELTSFRVRQLKNCNFRVVSTAEGRKIGLPAAFGPADVVAPVLSPVPVAGDRVLAKYSDGSPAVVLRPGKYPSVFCGTTVVPTALARYLARLSGVHLYTVQDACVFANRDFLAVYAPYDGTFEIDTGVSGQYRSALSGTPLGNGPRLKLPMQKGETIVLERAQ
ncbi:MAG: beta-galactosidase [Victivallaceae bacterium]|nr:beta-galactosidase [Victivallaceae bacterium]